MPLPARQICLSSQFCSVSPEGIRPTQNRKRPLKEHSGEASGKLELHDYKRQGYIRVMHEMPQGMIMLTFRQPSLYNEHAEFNYLAMMSGSDFFI